MRKLRLFGLLVAVCSTTTLFAGAVNSGGGKGRTIRDNPWFVKNTDEVSFCIESSKVHFPSETRLEQLIQDTVALWRGGRVS